MEGRKAFTFFRSYYDAASLLDDPVEQGEYLMAVCSYAFTGEMPELTGAPAAMFALTKPTLDVSRIKAEAGAKGGASKHQADGKQNESKSEAESKQAESKPQAIKDKGLRIEDKGLGREKENREREKTPTPTPTPKSKPVQWAENVTMTNDEHNKLLAAYGPADTARLIEMLDNYKGSSGKKYRSDYRAILSWCVQRLQDEKAKWPRQQSSGNVFADMVREGLLDE